MKSLLRCLHSFGGGTKSNRLIAALAVGLLLLSYPSALRAQALSGIQGTVTDSSGAVVPDAKVTVTNTATGVASRAVTSSSGTFTITDLIPGAYTVKIEKPGFATAVMRQVNVDVASRAAADAVMKAGAATDTVEVVAQAITLETTQPELGTVVETKVLEELPNQIGGLGRQIDNFLFLAPGITGNGFSHRINGGLDF